MCLYITFNVENNVGSFIEGQKYILKMSKFSLDDLIYWTNVKDKPNIYNFKNQTFILGDLSIKTSWNGK